MSNIDNIDETLIESAKEFIESSDVELMALSLDHNANHKDNYQMAMSIKLKSTVLALNQESVRLRKSMSISSWVMGFMTLFILILTGVIVWKGF